MAKTTKTTTKAKTQGKRRFVRLGTVLNTKTGKPALKLGNDYGDAKYHYSVEVTIRNAAGEVVAEQKDGFVNFYDPRDNSDRNVPEAVLYEASIGLEE